MFDWITKPYVLWSLKDDILSTVEIIIFVFILILIYVIVATIKEKINDIKRGGLND